MLSLIAAGMLFAGSEPPRDVAKVIVDGNGSISTPSDIATLSYSVRGEGLRSPRKRKHGEVIYLMELASNILSPLSTAHRCRLFYIVFLRELFDNKYYFNSFLCMRRFE